MSPEINPFDQPLSSLRNLTHTKKDLHEKKIETSIQDKQITDFKEELAWQKELESEDPEFMKDVKIELIYKLEKAINLLEKTINNPDTSSVKKSEAQEELEKRITQYNSLLSKYKNDV